MFIPLILSGGTGSRLWPVSREADPKPFMKLPDGETLLQKTFRRASTLEGASRVLTVTNREYYFRSRDEYSRALAKSAHVEADFLLEPFGRNTAPAIAMGALRVAEQYGTDATLLVLAADHLIYSAEGFQSAVRRALALAERGFLVTFGVPPTGPETGYGYIQCGDSLEPEGAWRVARFVEKPTRELAETYVATSEYFWNSGMFCFTVQSFLDQLEAHAPQMHEAVLRCWEATRGACVMDGGPLQIDTDTFAPVPDISVDYAVMEKSDRVAVIRGDFGWSDVGSWNAITELSRPDDAGNTVVGEAVLIDVANSLVKSEGRIVAAVGVENLIIVDTPDALLVADRDRSQDVKKVVEQLKLREHEAVKLHKTVTRPWGTYTVLEQGDRFKIKRLVVKPGHALSLQLHYHRSEHWVVVSGTARITNGENTILVRTNESTYIPAGNRHRLENPGVVDLVLIEVQSGEYLGEDDIVRFEDQYGRV
jgi:mannose-1-phosphate guanylyltransferase/mannose-6-phosphate isomerase